MTVAALALAGCVEMADMPAARAPVRPTGDPVIDGNAAQAAAPGRDRVLWDYRIAASALRAGNFAEAKAKLDDAISGIGGIIAGPDDAARRARKFFTAESEKTLQSAPSFRE